MNQEFHYYRSVHCFDSCMGKDRRSAYAEKKMQLNVVSVVSVHRPVFLPLSA